MPLITHTVVCLFVCLCENELRPMQNDILQLMISYNKWYLTTNDTWI